MKILHVSGANSWGGNEQQLVDLIYGLKKINIENTIFCFKNSPLEIYAKANHLKYFSIPKAKGHSFKYAKSLMTITKDYQPDVIHIHTSNSVTAYVIADILFKLKIPAVFSKKGIGGSSSFLSRLKYNYNGIKRIICVSKAVEEAFKKIIKPKNYYKLCVVYDGIKTERSENKSSVNLRRQFGIDDSKILIGNIANHTRAKDLVTFVEVANELINNVGEKNVHFIQIGKQGKYSKEFLPLIKKYNLEKYITIAGFLENAMDLLSQLDIYLMTSEREGLPITIYEAFLKKIPVVSTRAGGIPEAIIHDENGFLCDVKDSIGLADKLQKLINDETKRCQFITKSYALLFEKFTTKQLAEHTSLIYKNVVNG